MVNKSFASSDNLIFLDLSITCFDSTNHIFPVTSHNRKSGILTKSIKAKRQALIVACPDLCFALSSDYLAHSSMIFVMGSGPVFMPPSHRAQGVSSTKTPAPTVQDQPKAQIDYSITCTSDVIPHDNEPVKASWGLSSGVFCSRLSGA